MPMDTSLKLFFPKQNITIMICTTINHYYLRKKTQKLDSTTHNIVIQVNLEPTAVAIEFMFI